MKIANKKVRVFYSYSHKDEELRNCFEAHMSGLKRKGIIEEWHDRKILPGELWENSINKNINSADLILFLVSSDFMASDYCYNKEVIKAVEKHHKGLCEVVPIIIRECDWEGAPFEAIQGLPTDMKPIISRHWHDKDEAFTDVVKGLKKIIKRNIKPHKAFKLPDVTQSPPSELGADLSVAFRDLISGREVSVVLDNSITFKEAITNLIQEKILTGENDYFCTSKTLNNELDEESTFFDKKIPVGDTILIGVRTYAG